jgi:hypothetical protein
MLTIRTFVYYTALACLGLFSFSSCSKIDELVNPKDVEEKTVDLMVGSWRVDSVISRRYEQTLLTGGTVLVNRGTVEFKQGSPSTLYGPRPYVMQYTDTAGAAVTSAGYWSAGNYFSSSIRNDGVTLFTNLPGQVEFTSATGVVYGFAKKENNRVVIDGGTGYEQGGITVRSETRWVLSR